MTTWVSRAFRRPLLKLRRRQWRDLIEELHRRSEGRRECGAFLLAHRGRPRQVSRIVYYDDLDPQCLLAATHIHINGHSYSRLWDICEAEDLIVAADVHTHPGTSVHQSTTDRESPMVARNGHIALILPNFAAPPITARGVGVHRYAGDDGWQSWFGHRAARRLAIRMWT